MFKEISNQKKRHHYIPITYLNNFTDGTGRVFAYRKDEAEEPLHVRPREIAFERYYYSQPLQDGGRDNHALENFFSKFETTWPSLVSRLSSNSNLASDLETLCNFLIMMRVRVPAMRDMIEIMLSERIKLETRSFDKKGLLPPKPAGHGDILDHLNVSIDPHRSLHAIPDLARGFGWVLSCLEFEVLHNKTDISILTSDNPVICFDPHVPEVDVLPYQIMPPHAPIELLFPISSTLIIRGRTGRANLRHNVLVDNRPVERINRFISRFGYRFIFANDQAHDAIIEAHAATSPVANFVPIRSAQGGEGLFARWVFGSRPSKPKWINPSEQPNAMK